MRYLLSDRPFPPNFWPICHEIVPLKSNSDPWSSFSTLLQVTMKTVLLTVILVVVVIHSTNSQLNTACGVNSGTYCLTERQFVSCDLTALEKFFTCPLADQFCADVAGSCTTEPLQRTQNTFCDTCSREQGLGHACTSHTTFAACTDGIISYTNIHQCPVGTYCNAQAINTASPCSAFTGKELLCWKNEPEIPSVSDEDRCAGQGDGKYPVVEDTTCRT